MNNMNSGVSVMRSANFDAYGSRLQGGCGLIGFTGDERSDSVYVELLPSVRNSNIYDFTYSVTDL